MKKPHIYFSKGYWRVSPKPRPYYKHRELWDRAYAHKMVLNFRMRQLDATLDYSWISPLRLRGTHIHSYRSGIWATIVSIVDGPGVCWKVRYDDGMLDVVAARDTDNYELEYPA